MEQPNPYQSPQSEVSTDGEQDGPNAPVLSTLAWWVRVGSVASVGGAVYSAVQALTLPGMGPLPYLFLCLPMYAVMAVLLFVVSNWLLDPGRSPPQAVRTARRRLAIFVDGLVGVGAIALLIEAAVIWTEAKRTQAIELGLLVAMLMLLRVFLRFRPETLQYRVNVGHVIVLALGALFWMPVLSVVLAIFD